MKMLCSQVRIPCIEGVRLQPRRNLGPASGHRLSNAINRPLATAHLGAVLLALFAFLSVAPSPAYAQEPSAAPPSQQASAVPEQKTVSGELAHETREAAGEEPGRERESKARSAGSLAGPQNRSDRTSGASGGKHSQLRHHRRHLVLGRAQVRAYYVPQPQRIHPTVFCSGTADACWEGGAAEGSWA